MVVASFVEIFVSSQETGAPEEDDVVANGEPK